MGLFDLFKKKGTRIKKVKSKVLLSMPMFNSGDSYDLNKVIEHLKTFWGLKISGLSGNNEATAFNIEDELVALAYIPYQIPWSDIKETAQYAYNWVTAEKDLESHKSHAIVSIMTEKMSPVDRFSILSKLLCSILLTSNSIGIYQGNESLLIPREQYLGNLNYLKAGGIPVLLWVYIGLRKSDIGNSAYTYGLANFKKQEIEIINSKLGLEELHEFLSNISSYVIDRNVTLKSGETFGYTEDQKVKITSSKGQFVDGNSLKLEM